jgi:hypothetical protein
MYKPISNCIGSILEEKPRKSLICGQVEKGEIYPNQSYCCSPNANNYNEGSCNSLNLDFSSQFNCFEPNEIALCNNVNTIDACRRADGVARQVCNNLQSFFCLSTSIKGNENMDSKMNYTYPQIIHSMINRNKLEESYVETKFCCEYSKGCKLCSDPSYPKCVTASIFSSFHTCIDLFQNGCTYCDLN